MAIGLKFKSQNNFISAACRNTWAVYLQLTIIHKVITGNYRLSKKLHPVFLLIPAPKALHSKEKDSHPRLFPGKRRLFFHMNGAPPSWQFVNQGHGSLSTSEVLYIRPSVEWYNPVDWDCCRLVWHQRYLWVRKLIFEQNIFFPKAWKDIYVC